MVLVMRHGLLPIVVHILTGFPGRLPMVNAMAGPLYHATPLATHSHSHLFTLTCLNQFVTHVWFPSILYSNQKYHARRLRFSGHFRQERVYALSMYPPRGEQIEFIMYVPREKR